MHDRYLAAPYGITFTWCSVQSKMYIFAAYSPQYCVTLRSNTTAGILPHRACLRFLSDSGSLVAVTRNNIVMLCGDAA